MPDIATISAEYQTAKKSLKDLLDQDPDKPVSAENKAKIDALFAKTDELKAQMDDLTYRERKTAQFEDLTTYFEKDPQRKVPRGVQVGNNESDTKTVLAAMGWEVKGGIIHGMTSMGKLQPMWTSEMLFGDLAKISKNDPKAAKDMAATRATFQPEYRRIYGDYIVKVWQYGDEPKAWMNMEPYEQKALSEGTDTSGGVLVPPDIQSEVLARTAMASVMRGLCRVVPTSRDLLVWPMIAPAASTTGGVASGGGSIFTSAFVGSWDVETPAFVDVDLKINSFPIPVRKIRAATKVSNDLVSDSVFPFLSFLATDGAENIALVEDLGFIAGDGTGLRPMGILNAGITGVDVTGPVAHTVGNLTGTTVSPGSWPKILKVQASLPQQYQANATWLMHRLTELNIRTMTDTQLRPLWAPGIMGTTGDMGEQFPTLQAHPVRRSDFVPQDGTAAASVLIYADFNRYIIAQRAGITTTILRERFGDTDQTGILLWERVGGNFWNIDAGRIGTVT